MNDNLVTCAGHLKANIVFIPRVNDIERDFDPVYALCLKIAEFLEFTQSLSYIQRKMTIKTELVDKAKAYTLRVDEVNCQVIIQLNEYHANAAQNRNNNAGDNHSNHESNRDSGVSNRLGTVKFNNDFIFGALGMAVFVIIAIYLHIHGS